MRFRRVPDAETVALRSALRVARSGDGNGLIYELDRGFSGGVRAVARLVLGIGVVVAMLAAVAAFLIPSAAGLLLLLGVVPTVVLATGAAALGYWRDTGLRVFADGRMRREGWGGISERNVREYARVTVDGSGT